MIRPMLHCKVASADSRTERFVSVNFGAHARRHVAVELRLWPTAASEAQMLLVELLLDLLLRMDPVVEEVRIVSPCDPLAVTSTYSGPCDEGAMRLRRPSGRESGSLLRLAVGRYAGSPSMDATAWQLGFDGAHIQPSKAGIVGPVSPALEAAKHLFFAAAAEKDRTGPTAYPVAGHGLRCAALEMVYRSRRRVSRSPTCP